MYNFCTLFDSFYLSRGLTMYESLKNHTENFHLYIFAFDDKCFTILKEIDLEHVTVISLKEFETEELLEIKKNRTQGEYCWTCTPHTISYCLHKFNLNECTYIDADLYFFSNPNVLASELTSKDVLITEHRYTPKYDQTHHSGKYCVQFMTFKNTKKALNVLNWWKNACNEWCHAYFEDGKFGDQKYLDDWMTRFDCVHELQHLGGGVAPWNMQQYRFFQEENYIYGIEQLNYSKFPVIFFHFHNFKIIDDNLYALTEYQLLDDCRNTIYIKYAEHLNKNTFLLKEKYSVESNEYKLKNNFYMLYLKDKLAYLHA